MAVQPAAGRYKKMKYRRCGRTGLMLPAISLGMWTNFGGDDDYDNARAMMLRAFDLGITHFDIANGYGPPSGSAERTFARVLKEDLAAHRDEIIVSTKAGFLAWKGPYGKGGSRKYLLASIDQSLERLELDYIDIFYHHYPDEATPVEETAGALDQMVRQGKALYVGISSYTPERTAKMAMVLRQLGTPLLIHQPHYNLFERWIEHGLTDVLAAEGVGCIAFCPLAQGLLTHKYLGGVPEGSRAGTAGSTLPAKSITEDKLRRVRGLNEIAKARGQTLAQMALAWVLRLPAMTSALTGASRVEQIEQNVAALDHLDFSKEEIDAIDKLTEGLPVTRNG